MPTSFGLERKAMIFVETELAGAYLVELEKREDERGFFARLWCEREFATHGLTSRLAQVSLSFNRRRGTLRGMHYQAAPYEESKMVHCVRGAIYDVIIDLRVGSHTHAKWFGVELSADNRRGVFVPAGFAHGFLTLTDDAEVLYHISHPYVAAAARGVRFDDPAFGIRWPIAIEVIAERDRNWPAYLTTMRCGANSR
jgi:dTDP-4-dehydrorhamnose 3,5-epimerase